MLYSNWKFSYDILSIEEKILKMLFDEAPSEKDCFIRCMADMNIKKEIAQVELVKTLRLVKNKKLGK